VTRRGFERDMFLLARACVLAMFVSYLMSICNVSPSTLSRSGVP
jgi:hypothetical protein